MSDELLAIVALFEKKSAVPFKAVGERFLKISWGEVLVEHAHTFTHQDTHLQDAYKEPIYSYTLEISIDPYSAVATLAEMRNVPDWELMTYQTEYVWHEPIDYTLKSIETLVLENCTFFKN